MGRDGTGRDLCGTGHPSRSIFLNATSHIFGELGPSFYIFLEPATRLILFVSVERKEDNPNSNDVEKTRKFTGGFIEGISSFFGFSGKAER